MSAMPVIFDHSGKPMRSKYFWGEYEGAYNNRQRKLHRGFGYETPRTESEMLPMWDRLRIIAYLRRSIRNNPVVAALALRYALGIGSPTIHCTGPDQSKNDAKERAIESRMASIMHGTGWGLHRLMRVIAVEELVAGEVFAIEVENGKVQLVPSELVGSPGMGSPNGEIPENEIDGIGYEDDDLSTPAYYRVGVRLPLVRGGVMSRVSFLESDGATLVPAEFVTHLGQPMRIEERRFSPRLSSCVGAIEDLNDIVNAKVTTVKNQAAFSLFFTKNFDPGMFAEMMQSASSPEALIAGACRRSDYQDVRNGQIYYGEVGEDLKLIEPNLNAQDFDQFQLSRLDAICAPVGIPPEEVMVGYRRSNYSSARADRNKWKDAVIDIRKDRCAFLEKIVGDSLMLAVDDGELTPDAETTADVFYAWPVIREIDETKHVLAQAAAIDAGIMSRQQACAENARFADDTGRQIVRDAAYLAGLVIEESKRTGIPTQQIIAMMPKGADLSDALDSLASADSQRSASSASGGGAEAEGSPKS